MQSIEPNDNDVLSGRGGTTNMHQGNRAFRNYVSDRKHDYRATSKTETKNRIAQAVVDTVRANGGRFLQWNERNRRWELSTNDESLKKTKQCLREQPRNVRKTIHNRTSCRRRRSRVRSNSSPRPAASTHNCPQQQSPSTPQLVPDPEPAQAPAGTLEAPDPGTTARGENGVSGIPQSAGINSGEENQAYEPQPYFSAVVPSPFILGPPNEGNICIPYTLGSFADGPAYEYLGSTLSDHLTSSDGENMEGIVESPGTSYERVSSSIFDDLISFAAGPDYEYGNTILFDKLRSLDEEKIKDFQSSKTGDENFSYCPTDGLSSSAEDNITEKIESQTTSDFSPAVDLSVLEKDTWESLCLD